MKIYHGTNLKIGAIDLAKCRPDRDFGQGFYTTSYRHHAERRAQEIIRKSKQGEAVVIEYDFDWKDILEKFPNLKIKRFENVSGEWADFVMFNRLRNENEPSHKFDIVEGPVADDKMFRQFQLYADNRIELDEFVGRIKYNKEPTHQIAFCTKRAINALLKYNEPPRFIIEGLVADLSVALIKDYDLSRIDAMNTLINSALFTKIADESTNFYKKSWQELYDMLKKEIDLK